MPTILARGPAPAPAGTAVSLREFYYYYSIDAAVVVLLLVTSFWDYCMDDPSCESPLYSLRRSIPFPWTACTSLRRIVFSSDTRLLKSSRNLRFFSSISEYSAFNFMFYAINTRRCSSYSSRIFSFSLSFVFNLRNSASSSSISSLSTPVAVVVSSPWTLFPCSFAAYSESFSSESTAGLYSSISHSASSYYYCYLTCFCEFDSSTTWLCYWVVPLVLVESGIRWWWWACPWCASLLWPQLHCAFCCVFGILEI